jgi:hypothetical protein
VSHRPFNKVRMLLFKQSCRQHHRPLSFSASVRVETLSDRGTFPPALGAAIRTFKQPERESAIVKGRHFESVSGTRSVMPGAPRRWLGILEADLF